MAPARLPVGRKTSRYSYNGRTTIGQQWTPMKARRHRIGNSRGSIKIPTVADTDSTSDNDDDDDDDDDNNDSEWEDKHVRLFITDMQHQSVDAASSVNYCYSCCCSSCSSSSSRWYSDNMNGLGERGASLPGKLFISLSSNSCVTGSGQWSVATGDL